MLLDRETARGEGDVVIGRKEGDQANDQAAAGLEGTEMIESGPRALFCRQFWRSREHLAVSGGIRGAGSGRSHRGRVAHEGPGFLLPVPPCAAPPGSCPA